MFGSQHRTTPATVIAPYIRSQGYATVKLGKGGVKRSAYIHRLVAQAFLGPCPMRHEVCHSDGDKTNNVTGNLYWGTRKQNIADNLRMGKHPLGEAHGMAKLTAEQVTAIRADARRADAIAKDYPVSAAMVRRIKRRKNWSHL